MANTTTTVGVKLIRTIAVPVSDQDKALDFYLETLGFEKRMDASYGGGARWIEVAPRGAQTSVALMKATTPDGVGVNTGIRLETTDAAADYEALKAKGVRIDGGFLQVPVPMFVFLDPDGNRLVIVQGQTAR